MRLRIWFNPELRSRNYLVPGLLVVNMTLVGALLTALNGLVVVFVVSSEIWRRQRARKRAIQMVQAEGKKTVMGS